MSVRHERHAITATWAAGDQECILNLNTARDASEEEHEHRRRRVKEGGVDGGHVVYGSLCTVKGTGAATVALMLAY